MNVNKIIEVNDLGFSFGSKQVFNNVNFEIKKNEFCAIVGANGSGKTTLIKIISGLLEPTNGSVTFHPSSITKNNIGYVPQRHFFDNSFPINVRELVTSGLVISKKRKFKLTSHDKEIIEHSINSVGLTNMINNKVSELSGGQQQRVLIAKALAGEPEILILDEPTAGIDSNSQEKFKGILEHALKEHNTTVILISHDLYGVKDLVDKVIVLNQTVTFNGSPSDLIESGISLGAHIHDLPVWLENEKGAN